MKNYQVTIAVAVAVHVRQFFRSLCYVR